MRDFKLVVDESDKENYTGLNGSIEIVGSVPLFIISSELVDALKVTSEVFNAPEDSEIKNTLDKRYKYITTSVSPSTGLSSRIYFDTDLSDIVVIPSLELLGLDSDMISGTDITIKGYSIPNFPPVFKKNISSETILGRFKNISGNVSGTTYTERMVTDTDNFSSSNILLSNIIKIGKASDVLEDPDLPYEIGHYFYYDLSTAMLMHRKLPRTSRSNDIVLYIGIDF